MKTKNIGRPVGSGDKKIRKRKGRVAAELRLSGSPILSQKSEPVKVFPTGGFDDPGQVANILRSMKHILIESKTGVGLAANQAGYLFRIVIIKYYDEFLTMINPVIVDMAATKNIAEEGCLSYPGKSREIARYDWVEVAFLDEDGDEQKMMLGKREARIFQHEYDHLEGVCQVAKIEFSLRV